MQFKRISLARSYIWSLCVILTILFTNEIRGNATNYGILTSGDEFLNESFNTRDGLFNESFYIRDGLFNESSYTRDRLFNESSYNRDGLFNESSYTRDAVNSSSSREKMNPMPLTRPLNGSEVDVLMQEANSMFVSNTSFDDIINDNETQRLLLLYRERKRKVRLMTIQQEILQKLGLDTEFNISSRISEEQRMKLLSSLDETLRFREELNDTDVD